MAVAQRQSGEATRPARGLRTGFNAALPLPFMIVLPDNFSLVVAGLNFTFLHLYLMIAAPLAVMQLGTLRLTAADWLFFAYALWSAAMRLAHNGLVASGKFLFESLFVYLVVIASLRAAGDVRALLRNYVVLIAIIGALAASISFTGRHWVVDLAEAIGGRYPFFYDAVETRLGLTRAGIVTHPIVYGVFCASMLAMLWCASASTATAMTRAAIVVGATFFSLSSGPFLALFIQIGLIGVERVSRGVPARAPLIAAGAGSVLGALQVVGSHGIFGLVAAYLTLSPHTAWYRLLIWERVTQDIANHPIFGMNPANWSKGLGMTSSIDAQWLLTPLQAGLPALVMLVGFTLLTLRMVYRRTDVEVGPDLAWMRRGWAFSMAGVAFCGFTVAYFGYMQPQMHVILAIGAVMARMVAETSGRAPQEAAVAAPRRRVRPVIGDLSAVNIPQPTMTVHAGKLPLPPHKRK